jgi:hypothetical protein
MAFTVVQVFDTQHCNNVQLPWKDHGQSIMTQGGVKTDKKPND